MCGLRGAFSVSPPVSSAFVPANPLRILCVEGKPLRSDSLLNRMNCRGPLNVLQEHTVREKNGRGRLRFLYMGTLLRI